MVRTRLVILALLAPVLAAGRAAADGELEPEEGLFSGGAPEPYQLAVRDALLDADGFRLCQLLVIPSFSSEHAVYIVRPDPNGGSAVHARAPLVVSRAVRKHLAHAMMDEIMLDHPPGSGEYDGPAAERVALAKMRPVVDTRTAELDVALVDTLDAVCGDALLRVAHPRVGGFTLDGTTYHASHWIRGRGFIGGQAHSPAAGTIAAAYVELGLALERYADGPADKRDGVRREIVAKAAALRGLLGARRAASP